MNELHFQKLIYKHTDNINNRLHVPNIFLFDWESDFIVVRKSGYISEFEIKISVSDFKKDFGKSIFNFSKAFRGLPKHECLQKGAGPNHFYYVLPQDVWAKVEKIMPDWCGVLVIHDENTIYKKRDPKLLHGEKITDGQTRKILMSTYYRFMNRYKL